MHPKDKNGHIRSCHLLCYLYIRCYLFWRFSSILQKTVMLNENPFQKQNKYSNNLRHCPSSHAWNSIGGSPSHDMSGKSGLTHCLTLIWVPLPQVALQLCHSPQSPQAAEIYETCDQKTNINVSCTCCNIHITTVELCLTYLKNTNLKTPFFFCFVLFFVCLFVFCFSPDVLNRMWWYFTW